MKRELKFRAWHSTAKVMLYPENEKYNKQSYVFSWLEEGQPVEIMQFTGLKDKNGKEIYEGDLLNTKTTFENNMADRRFQNITLRQASFENGCFIDFFSGMPLFDKIYSIVSHKVDYEIVGNIYENPELL